MSEQRNPEPVIWLRPEQSPRGRPAERSRAQITAAALDLADTEGLDAVTMRAVAASLGTGPASLYRHVAHRDDLLDLMTDATAAEYRLPAVPGGDWRADLLLVAEQARAIMLRHPWLPALATTRPVLGPNAAAVLEFALAALADHPAPPAAKLEAFAMLSAMAATFAQHEVGDASGERTARQVAFLAHLAGDPAHPHLGALLAAAAADPAPAESADARFRRVTAALLDGLLPSSA